MLRKGSQAIVDRSVWKKVTRGEAGIKSDDVDEKVWKDIRGSQGHIMSTGKWG